MAKPCSLDLRVRILKDYDSGVPVEDLVVHYEVSRSPLFFLLKNASPLNGVKWALLNSTLTPQIGEEVFSWLKMPILLFTNSRYNSP